MHGFMIIIIGIIGIILVETIPQNYKYDNLKSSNDPIDYQSTNPDYRSLIKSSENSPQLANQPIQYFNKQFFIHTAPDEIYDEQQIVDKIGQSLKKNLRILFIKAPSNNGLTNAAEQLAKEQTSEHTVIYILNKYTDTVQLHNELEKLNVINPNKPEVHFIQYKTNEDANNAQNSIQLKYDKFGDGSLEIINEGIPDTISYDSVNTNQQSTNQQIDFNNGQSTSGINIENDDSKLINTYLPSLH